MSELVLSAERRDELSSLLDDERQLRGEHPKVAEYLDMAPRLSGTGNADRDAAFDLRFVHYMTGGVSVSSNPYWAIVGPSVSERAGRRVVDGGGSEGSARLAFAQMILQASYAYAIPSPEVVEWMTGVCAGRPVLELGAGRGYWAAQLSATGLAVDAYDSEPPETSDNVSFPQTPGLLQTWHHVADLDQFAARVRDRSDHVLFLCWPPGWGDPMASEALTSFKKAGGDRLVYIGEPKGGKSGDDAFHDGLAAGWTLESEATQHVSWWNLRDAAQCWVRPH